MHFGPADPDPEQAAKTAAAVDSARCGLQYRGPMPAVRRVSLLGLHPDERQAIAACLNPGGQGAVCYELSPLLNEADVLIANAHDAPSVQLVVATERLAATLFVGSAAPPGAVACISRPIDIHSLLSELDFLVAASRGLAAARLQAVAASKWKGDERRSQVARAAAEAAAVAAPQGPAPTALLVDDSEIALRYLETRLQRWGLVMDRALSSGRAIELMAQRHYNFVFLDVELGATSHLDGLALCQHIKRQQRRAAIASVVFLVSAHANEIDRVRGNLAGCDAYLSKPLDEVALRRLLMRHGLKARGPVLAEDASAAGSSHPQNTNTPQAG